MKDSTVGAKASEADACAPDFLARFIEFCRAAKPFMGFLATAVGLEF